MSTAKHGRGWELPAEGITGSDRVPTLKVALLGVVLLVFILVSVQVGSTRTEEDDVSATRAAHCSAAPAEAMTAIVASLTTTDKRPAVDRVGTVVAGTVGDGVEGRTGARFVSLQLREVSLARKATGDIATWLVSDGGRIEAVDRFARERSSQPPAPDDTKVTDRDSIESRWCAKVIGTDKWIELKRSR